MVSFASLLVAFAWTLLVGSACTTPADVRAAREAAIVEREADADALYAALEQTVEAHDFPVARRDEHRRRITTEYIDEGDLLRRRYFLSVVLAPQGMALRVNLVREAYVAGADGSTTWIEQARDDSVVSEELTLVEETYERWNDGR